jgi:hypothetical protein
VTAEARLVAVTPEIRAYIREILNNSREALRRCVVSQNFHLDEVFGYVGVPSKGEGMATVLPLSAREDVLKFVEGIGGEHYRVFAQEIMSIDAEPAQGRLRTLVDTPQGIFQVMVQVHEGALA